MVYILPPKATERSPAAGCQEQAGLTRPGRSCHCAQLVLSHTGTRPRAGMPALCLSPGDSEGGWGVGRGQPTAAAWMCSSKRPSVPWPKPRVSHPQNGSQHDLLQEAAETLQNAWHSEKTPGKLATPPACLSSDTHCQAQGAEGKEQKELPNSDSLSLRLG